MCMCVFVHARSFTCKINYISLYGRNKVAKLANVFAALPATKNQNMWNLSDIDFKELVKVSQPRA